MILRGTVFSEILEMDAGIALLVPNGFKQEEPYRTVYLLHGLSGNSSTWLDYSMLPVYAANTHAVFVMPEVGRSFYSDMKNGQKYFTYITEELPNIVKKVFNVSSARENTYVMGSSMGGFGALKIYLMNPERYRACCAFAPACPPLDGWLEDIRQNGETEAYRAKWGSQMPADFRAIFGENLEWQAENDLAELAQRCSYPKDRMEIYMTCGDGDYLLQYVEQFYAEMQTLGYTVDYEKWTGRHDMPFFDESLKKALGKYLAWK